MSLNYHLKLKLKLSIIFGRKLDIESICFFRLKDVPKWLHSSNCRGKSISRGIMLVLEEAVMGQRQHPGRGFKTKDVPKLFALPRKRSCNVLNQGNAKCKNLLR